MNSELDEESVPPTPSPTKKRNKTKPDWSTWGRRAHITVREAVALAKNMNPRYLDSLREKKDRRYKNYATRLKTVISNLGIDGPLKPASGYQINKQEPGDTLVYLADFIVFYEQLGFSLPAEMKQLTPPRPLSEMDSSNLEADNSSTALSKTKRSVDGDLAAKTKNMYTRFLRAIFSTQIKGSMDGKLKRKERVDTIKIFFERTDANPNDIPSEQSLTKILMEIDELK